MVDPDDRENTPVLTPTQPAKQIIRRFNPSPAKAPLREVNGNGMMVTQSVAEKRIAQGMLAELEPRDETEGVSDMDVYEKTIDEIEEAINASIHDENGFVPNGLGDDELVVDGTGPEDAENIQLPQQDDDNHDEEVDASFEPLPEEVEDAAVEVAAPPPTKANRRKRKSESLEGDGSSADHGSASPQPAKKARTATTKEHKEQASKGRKLDVHQDAASVRGVSIPIPARRKPVRQPGKVKDPNIHLSARQETELNEIIEKVAARPGKQKSLYILKREIPADESATHTRSGRVSVKPLAYWRNERCVYGGSPGGSHVQDGARFPLNSIKEIIRTEQVGHESDNPHSRKGGKNRKKAHKAHRSLHDEDVSSNISDDGTDPNAEPWETEIGIFQGPVLTWSSDLQAPVDVEEEMDIAYAPDAIITREVKGSTFRYAKLLSNGFFGSGIVELPPGGVKRPKNSRKMHMSFFVAAGRVTAQVGGVFGDGEQPGSRFSVGKGGFWQVPRGMSASGQRREESLTGVLLQEISTPLRMSWISQQRYSLAKVVSQRLKLERIDEQIMYMSLWRFGYDKKICLSGSTALRTISNTGFCCW